MPYQLHRGVATALYLCDGRHPAPRSNPLMFDRVRAWYGADGVKRVHAATGGFTFKSDGEPGDNTITSRTVPTAAIVPVTS